MSNKKVVIIGGGHGQSIICRGVKNIEDIDLTAIVTVADDGGSTGRLRKQFHIPAMGDIRNVLIAMAERESLLRDLMNYRFEDPEGTEEDVQGHNLGNLILTALTQQSGGFMEAIQKISDILNVNGSIVPATTQVISLYALMEDGVIVKGEANIPNISNHIMKVFYQDEVHATPEAVHAILEADLIIYGIGSVYTSILPNVIIPEIRKALKETKAKRVYICNAMTQPGETDAYSVESHVKALLQHGALVDTVVIASNEIPQEIVRRYEEEGSTVVHLSYQSHEYELLKRDLLDFKHNLVRHNSEKIKIVIEELLNRGN